MIIKTAGSSRAEEIGTRNHLGHMLRLACGQFDRNENKPGREQEWNEIRKKKSIHCNDHWTKPNKAEEDEMSRGHVI